VTVVQTKLRWTRFLCTHHSPTIRTGTLVTAVGRREVISDRIEFSIVGALTTFKGKTEHVTAVFTHTLVTCTKPVTSLVDSPLVLTGVLFTIHFRAADIAKPFAPAFVTTVTGRKCIPGFKGLALVPTEFTFDLEADHMTVLDTLTFIALTEGLPRLVSLPLVFAGRLAGSIITIDLTIRSADTLRTSIFALEDGTDNEPVTMKRAPLCWTGHERAHRLRFLSAVRTKTRVATIIGRKAFTRIAGILTGHLRTRRL
jgi:hypothetical protein